jgi:ABC-2 type transport system permease protein
VEADEKADEELEKAQERLSARVDEIEADDALDPIAKQQLLQQAQQDEQQRFSLIQAQIEQEKNETIRQIDMETNREVAAIEAKHRRRAIWLPPIPAILAGIVVLIIRLTNESKYIAPARRR